MTWPYTQDKTNIAEHGFHAVPSELLALLDQFPTNCEKEFDEGTVASIGLIAVHYILAYGRHDSTLVKILISERGMKDSTIAVLISFLRVQQGQHQLFNTMPKDTLTTYIVDTLIEKITNSEYLRRRLQSTRHDFILPLQPAQVAKLLAPLTSDARCVSRVAEEIESCVCALFDDMLEYSALKGKENGFVEMFIEGLVAFVMNKEDKKEASDAILSMLGNRWGIVLLKRESVPTGSFAAVALTIADMMLRNPQNVSILTFFGSILVPISLKPSREYDQSLQRIKLMVNGVIVLFISQFDLLTQHEKKASLLQRLGPLLLLRRIPASYFSAIRDHQHVSNLDFVSQSKRLGDYLVAILEGTDFTREERRLAADILGRSFPYAETPSSMHTTLFSVLCRRSFANFVGLSFKEPTEKIIHTIRQARAALYTTCVHLASTQRFPENVTVEYKKTAAFAACALATDLDLLVDAVSKELIELQTGCIEFFGTCFQKAISQMLEDGSHDEMVEASEGANAADADTPMTAITRVILDILIVGSPRAQDLWILCASVESEFTKLSDQLRICLWNSLIITAQRCPIDDGSMLRFGRIFLPRLLRWNLQAVDLREEVSSPLCQAAAMQVLATLLTRANSLDIFKGHDKTSPDILNWCLHSVQLAPIPSDSRHDKLRLAALKLLVALITFHSLSFGVSNGQSATFSPETLQKVISSIYHLATDDKNEDVRFLSSQLLQIVGMNPNSARNAGD